MPPTIRPCDASFGAVVTDVDLRNLDAASWQAIEDAFHEYAMLVFPAQKLDPDEQAAFGERFGEILYLDPKQSMKSVPLSNQRGDGTLLDEDETYTRVLRGNEGWHTDSSYVALAAKASVLSAHVVPSEGGGTEWADMRAAYEALDDATRERIADLSAYHSLYHSQAKIGHDAQEGSLYGFHGDGAPLRPLVKVHPVTGRKSLFIGRHAYGIPGLSKEESETLLEELLENACQAPRVLTHDWDVGDLVVWDNRCLLHRARPYKRDEPRVVVHTRIAGDPATEYAEPNPEMR
ncbi:MAG: TauD/TfdA family dioxygenase [Myxococcota bacterium]|nr:TauD/TfdA family dioxygenase [Myxococcota bacterium]